MTSYSALANLIPVLVDQTPASVMIRLPAVLPGNGNPLDTLLSMPETLRTFLASEVHPLLKQLEEESPLVLDPENGTWETLILGVHGHSGLTYLQIRNMLSTREHVTTLGIRDTEERAFNNWCSARRDSSFLDTSWDQARRGQRRIVWMPLEATHYVIDPGVYRIMDILIRSGIYSYSSCEGHPSGAHIGFRSLLPSKVRSVFASLGWTIEKSLGQTVVRMPKVTTVAERDTYWRALTDALERALGISPKF